LLHEIFELRVVELVEDVLAFLLPLLQVGEEIVYL